MMSFHHIAGYKFIALTQLSDLRAAFLQECQTLGLKGTILLSTEGANFSLAGTKEAITAFKTYLHNNPHFNDMSFKDSVWDDQPFQRMKVKIRKEIITMREPSVRPQENRAPSISPETFKQWLDEKHDMMVLDTRNEYEIAFGTFTDAVHLQLDDFSQFPEKAKKLEKNKPIVMFCTGGIRCEKAALHLMNSGFENVYQLEGGILNYFAAVGGDHFQGECFVFDKRTALDANLQTTGTQQCCLCRNPVKQSTAHVCSHSI